MYKSISIILPAYNEQDNIEAVVCSCLDYLPKVFNDFEIIVIDDGSIDNTSGILDRLAKNKPQVTVFHHSSNKGYGAALISGFQKATKDLIFFMDADRQFRIDDIAKLLPWIDRYDIVAGYRFKRKDRFYRQINTFLFKLAVRIFFNTKLRDIDCAFKLYRAEVLKNMVLRTRGALINTEIITKAKKQGRTITEIGVNHYPRLSGKATGARLKVIFRAFFELIRLRWQLWREKE